MRTRVAAVLLAIVALAAVGCAEPVPATGPSDPVSQDLYNRLNDERAARGLHALAWDQGLADMAQGWSGNLPNGAMHNPNLPMAVGENVARYFVSSADAHATWMNSDYHRQNLLSPNYGSVGIGTTCANGQIFVVANFRMNPGAPDLGPVPPRDPVARPDHPGAGC